MSQASYEHYVSRLRMLVPEGVRFLRSQFTAPAVVRWLAVRPALIAKSNDSKNELAALDCRPASRKDVVPPVVALYNATALSRV